jgi:hypothetical protein
MARVVVVHGIGHEWSGSALMGRDVAPALRDGVRHGSGLRLTEDEVACAFHGDVFCRQPASCPRPGRYEGAMVGAPDR